MGMKNTKQIDDLDYVQELLDNEHVWKDRKLNVSDILNRLLENHVFVEFEDSIVNKDNKIKEGIKNDHIYNETIMIDDKCKTKFRNIFKKLIQSSFCCTECISLFHLWNDKSKSCSTIISMIEMDCIKNSLETNFNMALVIDILLNNWKVLKNNEIRVLWLKLMNAEIIGKYSLSGCTFSMIILFMFDFETFKHFAQTFLSLHDENKLFLHTGLEEWNFIKEFYEKKFRTNAYSEISHEKAISALFIYLCIDGVYFDESINDIILMYTEIPMGKRLDFMLLKILFCIFTKSKKINFIFKQLIIDIAHSDHTVKILEKTSFRLKNDFIMYTQDIYILIDSLPMFIDLQLSDVYFKVMSNLKENLARKELYKVILVNNSKIFIRDFITNFLFCGELFLLSITDSNSMSSHQYKTKSLVKRSLEVLVYEFYNFEKLKDICFLYNLLTMWNKNFIEIVKMMEHKGGYKGINVQDFDVLLEFFFFDISNFVLIKNLKLFDIYKNIKKNVRIIFENQYNKFVIMDKHKIFYNVLIRQKDIQEFIQINPNIIYQIILFYQKYQIIIPEINVFFDILQEYHFDKHLFIALLDLLTITELFDRTTELLDLLSHKIDVRIDSDSKSLIINKLSQYDNTLIDNIIRSLKDEKHIHQYTGTLVQKQNDCKINHKNIKKSSGINIILNKSFPDEDIMIKDEVCSAKTSSKIQNNYKRMKLMHKNNKNENTHKKYQCKKLEINSFIDKEPIQNNNIETIEFDKYSNQVYSDPLVISYEEKPQLDAFSCTLNNENEKLDSHQENRICTDNVDSYNISICKSENEFYDKLNKKKPTVSIDQKNTILSNPGIYLSDNTLKKDIKLINESYNKESYKPFQKKTLKMDNPITKKPLNNDFFKKTDKSKNFMKNIKGFSRSSVKATRSILNQFNKPIPILTKDPSDKKFDPYQFSDLNLLPPVVKNVTREDKIENNFIYQSLLSNYSSIRHIGAQKYSFTNIADYLRFFIPLVINEIKSCIKKDNNIQKKYEHDFLKLEKITDFGPDLSEAYFSVKNNLNYIENDLIEFKIKKYIFQGILKETVSIKEKYILKIIINRNAAIKCNDYVKHKLLSSLNTYFREYNALFYFKYFALKNHILNPGLIENHATTEESIKTYKELFNVNHHQAEVLAYIANPSNKITLVQGPPGSGKTTLIVALINAFFSKIIKVDRVEGKSRILICAPSNTAIDEVIKRLRMGITLTSGESFVPFIIRMGCSNNISDETKDISLEYFLKEFDSEYSSIKNLRKIELLIKSDIICSTLSSSVHDSLFLTKLNIDLLIIDEACQSVETSTLIPLKHNPRKILMIGDPKQLPPTVINSSQFYEFSLFQRLSKFFKPLFLNTQYRMSEGIVELPSKLFYDSLLRTDPSCNVRENPFDKILDSISFINIDGQEVFVDNTSFINQIEAVEILSFINQINKFTETRSVAIISPYKAQVNYLTKMLKDISSETIKNIDINTVDAFQGQEKDLVIISAVRSDKIGFIYDERRLNVALTRAKFACVIFGNANFLSTNELWCKVINFCRDKNNFYDKFDFSRMIENKLNA